VSCDTMTAGTPAREAAVKSPPKFVPVTVTRAPLAARVVFGLTSVMTAPAKTE